MQTLLLLLHVFTEVFSIQSTATPPYPLPTHTPNHHFSSPSFAHQNLSFIRRNGSPALVPFHLQPLSSSKDPVFVSYCSIARFPSVLPTIRCAAPQLEAWYPTQSHHSDWSRLVDCWSFVSWQHLSLYQDRHRLVTVCTHGDFIVVLHKWQTRTPAPWPDIHSVT